MYCSYDMHCVELSQALQSITSHKLSITTDRSTEKTLSCCISPKVYNEHYMPISITTDSSTEKYCHVASVPKYTMNTTCPQTKSLPLFLWHRLKSDRLQPEWDSWGGWLYMCEGHFKTKTNNSTNIFQHKSLWLRLQTNVQMEITGMGIKNGKVSWKVGAWAPQKAPSGGPGGNVKLFNKK